MAWKSAETQKVLVGEERGRPWGGGTPGWAAGGAGQGEPARPFWNTLPSPLSHPWLGAV